MAWYKYNYHYWLRKRLINVILYKIKNNLNNINVILITVLVVYLNQMKGIIMSLNIIKIYIIKL